MILQLLVGSLLGLLLAAVIVALVLKRQPLLFVADKLPGNLYGGADDVGDLVDGEIEEGAVDAGSGSTTAPDDGSGRDGGSA